jgi:uncharacterized protein YkwD
LVNLFVPTNKNGYKPLLLRNGALGIYTLFLLVINSFGGLLGLESAHASTITTSNIVQFTNEQRELYGLPTLKNNSKLASAALAKANNMFSVGYWNHFGPNGETPWQFIKASGYSYVYAGENLAKGFKSAEGVVEAWMASPTHRENILSGNYTEIGIAVVSGQLLSENVILVVQMFGNPTSATVPSPTNVKTPTQTEKGDTSSIRITSPKDNSVINDANVDIKGEVNKVQGTYTVEVSDKGFNLGGFETNGQTWSWDKKSDWTDGEHNVGVSIKDGKLKDTVKFTIDTQAPKVAELASSLTTSGWELTGKIDDKAGTLSIVSGDFNQNITIEKDGTFKTVIPTEKISSQVVIVTSDTIGNSLQTDISEYFEQEGSKSVLSVFNSIVSDLGNKDTLNALFLGFILLLLLIEVVTYWRRGLLSKHGGNLFTLGFWWVLLLIGVANGFSGVIN